MQNQTVERILKRKIYYGYGEWELNPSYTFLQKQFITITQCVNITGRIQGVLVVGIPVKKVVPLDYVRALYLSNCDNLLK